MNGSLPSRNWWTNASLPSGKKLSKVMPSRRPTRSANCCGAIGLPFNGSGLRLVRSSVEFAAEIAFEKITQHHHDHRRHWQCQQHTKETEQLATSEHSEN